MISLRKDLNIKKLSEIFTRSGKSFLAPESFLSWSFLVLVLGAEAVGS